MKSAVFLSKSAPRYEGRCVCCFHLGGHLYFAALSAWGYLGEWLSPKNNEVFDREVAVPRWPVWHGRMRGARWFYFVMVSGCSLFFVFYFVVVSGCGPLAWLDEASA